MTAIADFFTIKGERYFLKPYTMGIKIWIHEKYATEETWNKLLGVDRDPECIVGTVWAFMKNESRAKFEDPGALGEVLPAGINYQLLLYCRIMNRFGMDYPTFPELDMENLTADDMKKVQAELARWRETKAKELGEVMNLTPAAS